MATHIHLPRPHISRKSYTPLTVLQIFAGALVFTVCILTVCMFLLRTVYDWEPTTASAIAYSPIYAIAAAGACLILSFLIPEYLLDSARRELRKHTSNEQTEDIPFVLVPCVFIRFALLGCVSMLGFVLAMHGAGSPVFLPFAIVSLALMSVYFPTEPRMKAWLGT